MSLERILLGSLAQCVECELGVWMYGEEVKVSQHAKACECGQNERACLAFVVCLSVREAKHMRNERSSQSCEVGKERHHRKNRADSVLGLLLTCVFGPVRGHRRHREGTLENLDCEGA